MLTFCFTELLGNGEKEVNRGGYRLPGPPRLESLRSRNGVASLRKWSRFAPGWKILHIFDGNPIGDHIMHHHMVAGAEGARHHVVRGGRRPPLMMWPPIVFWALATPCFLGFGQSIFFELLAPIILGASWGQKIIFYRPPCK